jgi:hypothetical protein
MLVPVVAAAASAFFDARGRIVATDTNLFASAGSWMLSGDWAHTYHTPTVQAGPLELALAFVARTAGRGAFGFALILDLACTLAVLAVAGWFLRGNTGALVAVAVGAVALQIPREGFRGHPAELLVPLIWMVAAREARSGRVLLAGTLLGVSGCLELWGVLGIGVLALAPLTRRTAAGAAIAVAIPAAALAPFAAGGDFHMFELQWRMQTGLLRLLTSSAQFTWYDRVAEGIVVVAAGIVLARATRRFEDSVWVVPAAIVLARIALDPVNYFYYWDTPIVLFLIGAASLVARRGHLISDQAPAASCR